MTPPVAGSTDSRRRAASVARRDRPLSAFGISPATRGSPLLGVVVHPVVVAACAACDSAARLGPESWDAP
jgi:hypothetical protein